MSGEGRVWAGGPGWASGDVWPSSAAGGVRGWVVRSSLRPPPEAHTLPLNVNVSLLFMHCFPYSPQLPSFGAERIRNGVFAGLCLFHLSGAEWYLPQDLVKVLIWLREIVFAD